MAGKTLVFVHNYCICHLKRVYLITINKVILFLKQMPPDDVYEMPFCINMHFLFAPGVRL